MTTTRERPESDDPKSEADRTIVDGSPEDLWSEETEVRPGTTGDRQTGMAGDSSLDLPQSAVDIPGLDSDAPASIGPYRIERKLGAGGMGTVYLGRHTDTDELSAVKVLSASLARESEIVERFAREIDAMQKLSGPHIVSLLDSGTDADTGQMYFSMEYVDGQTLGELICDRKRLAWDEAVDIALQICTALKAAHAAGIVHRDLKPSNLLVGRDGVVHLTDFGIAQVFAAQRLTVTGGIIGTAEFMSPEQAEGRRCTKKSDLYSLGAVIYAMLTGRPPFTGKSSIDILRQHLTGRFDRPSLYAPDTPRLLDELVCKLLEKQPDDRYPEAHIVSLRLREIVRRDELASDNETAFRESLDGDGLAAPTTPGRPAPDATIVDGPNVPRGPGPATLMRNALKSEIARAQRRSSLGEFLDQTWVLVLLLVLLVAGGIAWFQVVTPSTNTEADVPVADDDVSRFLKLAAAYRRMGDTAGEERVLRALRAIVQHLPERRSELARIDKRLADIEADRQDIATIPSLGRAGLEKADRLIESGEIAAARDVLQGLLFLYESDPGARELVNGAQERLRVLEVSGETAIP